MKTSRSLSFSLFPLSTTCQLSRADGLSWLELICDRINSRGAVYGERHDSRSSRAGRMGTSSVDCLPPRRVSAITSRASRLPVINYARRGSTPLIGHESPIAYDSVRFPSIRRGIPDFVILWFVEQVTPMVPQRGHRINTLCNATPRHCWPSLSNDCRGDFLTSIFTLSARLFVRAPSPGDVARRYETSGYEERNDGRD